MGEMQGVNLGCLDNVSDQALSQLRIVCADGRSGPWPQAPLHLSPAHPRGPARPDRAAGALRARA